MPPWIFASMPSVARCRSSRSAVRRQVPLEPLLRLLREDVLLERAGYLAHQRVPRGLYAEEHLPQELHLPAAVPELGRKYPQVFSKLLSRFERNYAIIPHVGPPWLVFGTWHYTTPCKWNRLFAYFTFENASRPMESGTCLVSGVKNRGYSSSHIRHLSMSFVSTKFSAATILN